MTEVLRCVTCDWLEGHIMHGPVEPGCPDPGSHHTYRPLFGSSLSPPPASASPGVEPGEGPSSGATRRKGESTP